MRPIYAAVVVVSLLGAGAAAAETKPALPSVTEPPVPALTAPRERRTVALVPASALIGRIARDVAGKEVGEVRYVVVDPAHGQVRHVVVGSGGALDLGAELTALPWATVAGVAPTGTIRLRVGRDAVAAAPRFADDRVGELGRATLAAALAAHYGLPAEAATPVPAKPAVPPKPRAAEASAPSLVLGREYVVAAAGEAPPPPAVRALVGERVATAGGIDLGQLDEAMIDVQAGRLAYVLLARDGFLGLGQDWVPLPPAALRWAPDGRSYVLEGAVHDMQGFPPARGRAVMVRGDDLAELYRRYGAAPYWP